MRLVNIAQRTITVDLGPEDCVLLARACHSAVNDSESWKRGGPAPVLDALHAEAAALINPPAPPAGA